MKIAIAYVTVGLILAVISAVIIGKLKMEKYLEEFVKNIKSNDDIEIYKMTKNERLIYAKNQIFQTIKKVYIYIFIGSGTFIHNVIPTEWIERVLGENNWYSVFLASLTYITMYTGIFGTLHIA